MQQITLEAKRCPREYWKDLYRARELFYFFTWRDVLVRYKQAFFGVAWALLRPLITMALFTLIFSQLAHFPSEGVPYPLFALAGMVPWMLFSSSLTETTVSLLNNPSLLSRVYFPRMIIPASQVLVQMVDFLVALTLLLFLLVFSVSLPWSLLALPLFSALAFALCLGCGLFLSAVTVQYRDIRYVVPFLVQVGIYLSPVGYGSFMIPERWQGLYFLNPMAGIIEGFRWSLFGIAPDYLWKAVSLAIVITGMIFWMGYRYFRKVEAQFGDII